MVIEDKSFIDTSGEFSWSNPYPQASGARWTRPLPVPMDESYHDMTDGSTLQGLYTEKELGAWKLFEDDLAATSPVEYVIATSQPQQERRVSLADTDELSEGENEFEEWNVSDQPTVEIAPPVQTPRRFVEFLRFLRQSPIADLPLLGRFGLEEYFPDEEERECEQSLDEDIRRKMVPMNGPLDPDPNLRQRERDKRYRIPGPFVPSDNRITDKPAELSKEIQRVKSISLPEITLADLPFDIRRIMQLISPASKRLHAGVAQTGAHEKFMESVAKDPVRYIQGVFGHALRYQILINAARMRKQATADALRLGEVLFGEEQWTTATEVVTSPLGAVIGQMVGQQASNEDSRPFELNLENFTPSGQQKAISLMDTPEKQSSLSSGTTL